MPDLYLSELWEYLLEGRGVDVSKELFTIEVLQERRCAFGSILLTANLRCHLQVSCPAIKRNKDKHAEYQIKVAKEYLPEQLVFVDKSACNHNTTKHKYAWAPINGWAT